MSRGIDGAVLPPTVDDPAGRGHELADCDARLRGGEDLNENAVVEKLLSGRQGLGLIALVVL